MHSKFIPLAKWIKEIESHHDILEIILGPGLAVLCGERLVHEVERLRNGQWLHTWAVTYLLKPSNENSFAE